MTDEEILFEIKRICISCNVKSAYLFGSRAKGVARERSDFDVAVSGADNVDILKDKLDQIPTLHKIDLVDLDSCRNDLLKEDILRYGQKI